MRTVSSYGVEIRKQNIPVRQTMEIYRQAVGYLTEIYAQVWEELRKIPETKKRFNTAEHMVHMTKKTQPGLILTFVFRRCRLTSAGPRSSMRLEVYLRMRPGWGSGKRPECCPEGRNLPAGTMPCRSFTGM